jgi:flagellar basal-body rod modification protein FlgD
MAINVNGATPQTADPAPKTTASTKASMDRDAFLKLLVAQISHQDPLKPMEGTEYVTQLSQFSALEQAIQQTSKLDMLSTQLTGLSSNEATSLVGKTVSIRSGALAFDGVTATGASVTLGGPTAKTTAVIRDQDGKVVRTMEIGPHAGGVLAVQWDGKDDLGNPVAKGAYKLDVKAQDGAGAAVDVKQEVTGLVTRVSFEKGYPEVQLDSGATAPVSDLVSVGMTPEK